MSSDRSEVATKTLKFVNHFYEEMGQEALVSELTLLAGQDHKEIIEWYEAYYIGDPVKVYIDDEFIKELPSD